MRVYRVEDAEGGGPYNGENSPPLINFYWAAVRDGTVEHERVDPETDIHGFKHSQKYRFAFSSLDQLAYWFSPGPQRLFSDYGYSVGVYEVPDDKVFVGNRQVAYPHADAKLVKRISLPLVNGG